MKLDTQTIAILKNFSEINKGIWINEGNVLRTFADPGKNILAEATVKDEFPVSFGIYDLNSFLGILSLHKESPELDFDKHHVVVKGLSGKSRISYRFTDKEMIVTKDKKLTLPSEDVVIRLEEDDYNWVANVAKTLQSPNISLKSDGENPVVLTTFDAKNNSAHTEQLEIGPVNSEIFNHVFHTSDWNKIIAGSYTLKISNKGLAHFKHETNELEYFIGLVTNSTKTED